MPDKNIKFRMYEGKSGKTWLVGITEDWKDHIYVSADPRENKGFGGNRLTFNMEDGSIYSLTGPWHSNTNSFLADVKEIQSTFKP